MNGVEGAITGKEDRGGRIYSSPSELTEEILEF